MWCKDPCICLFKWKRRQHVDTWCKISLVCVPWQRMEYVKEYWEITEYYKNGVLHRDGDLPAVISARGDLEYWKNGKRHRDNGPAVIRKNGVCSWYKNGVHLETC